MFGFGGVFVNLKKIFSDESVKKVEKEILLGSDEEIFLNFYYFTVIYYNHIRYVSLFYYKIRMDCRKEEKLGMTEARLKE